VTKKKWTTLTEAELRLMNVLWEKSEATVGEITEALPARVGLAYNTGPGGCHTECGQRTAAPLF
jgi:hypothetical protein